MNIPLSLLAQIVGAAQADVQSTLAALTGALTRFGGTTDDILIAAIATVRVECPKFRPQHEEGTDEYFRHHYDLSGNPHLALELGNTEAGDGIRYTGRGLIQLTGRGNYRKYGTRIGQDLEGNPDLALKPGIAAEVFALYFRDHNCFALANVQDWTEIRRKVNGGLNNLALFLSIITKLLRENGKAGQ